MVGARPAPSKQRVLRPEAEGSCRDPRPPRAVAGVKAAGVLGGTGAPGPRSRSHSNTPSAGFSKPLEARSWC